MRVGSNEIESFIDERDIHHLSESNLLAIKYGREGLAKLLANPEYVNFVNRVSLSAEAKSRISYYPFTDYPNTEPFFNSKVCYRSSDELRKAIRHSSDEFIKWFLLLYCISSTAFILKNKILKCFDDIKSLRSSLGHRWGRWYNFDFTFYHDPHFHGIFDGIFDIDYVYNKLFGDRSYFIPHEFYPGFDEIDQRYNTIIYFSLTAGYHYAHDIELFPEVLLSRGVDFPFILSTSMFKSVMTGNDFYDELEYSLKEIGAEGRLDDVIAMARNGLKLDVLDSEKKKLEALLAENDEKTRPYITVREILTESFGEGFSKEEVERRISKCNDKEHRGLLYEIESLVHRRLSFLDHLDQIDEPFLDQIQSKHGVVLSEREIQKIKTIEQLIDTILRHRSFIDGIRAALLKQEKYNGTVSENDEYDLKSRIEEVERATEITLDDETRESIHSLKDLQEALVDKDLLLLEIESFIVERMGVEPEEVTFRSNFTNDLGADSLDSVELLMEAERKYGIRIPDERTPEIATVADLYFVVREIMNSQSPPGGTSPRTD